MIPVIKLPPSLQMALFLFIGLLVGSIGGYKYAMVEVESKMAKNELHLIIDDKKEVKKIDVVTEKVLLKVREDNEKHKPFDCSDAVLPDDRVQRLQREIDNAGRRFDPTLLDRAIEKASHL